MFNYEFYETMGEKIEEKEARKAAKNFKSLKKNKTMASLAYSSKKPYLDKGFKNERKFKQSQQNWED